MPPSHAEECCLRHTFVAHVPAAERQCTDSRERPNDRHGADASARNHGFARKRARAIGIRGALNRGLGNGTTLAEPMSDWMNPTCSERGNFGASDEWLSSLSHEDAHMGQFIQAAQGDAASNIPPAVQSPSGADRSASVPPCRPATMLEA